MLSSPISGILFKSSLKIRFNLRRRLVEVYFLYNTLVPCHVEWGCRTSYHLILSLDKPALFIKLDVMIRTNKRRLVTSNLFANIHQRMNNLDPQFLPLLRLRDSNILNVSRDSTRVDELRFDEKRANAH